MAKKTEAQLAAEAAEQERLNKETLEAAKTIGRDDSGWLEGMNEADPFERMPTFMPGKPGFNQVGESFLGEFVRAKVVVNENSPWARINPKTGQKEVTLVTFRDPKGNPFGIWGVGGIRAAAQCLREGDKLRITYLGLGEPLKPGQNPPHTFKFEGKRKDGSKLVFDWDAIEDDSHEPVPAAQTTAPSTSARQ